MLEIDAGQQAEFSAFIARIPGAKFFVVSTNDVRSGALPAGQLSQRLEQVLQLIRKGMTNKSIGRHLGISHFTVRNHVTRLLQIHGARNRDELIAITGALREGRARNAICRWHSPALPADAVSLHTAMNALRDRGNTPTFSGGLVQLPEPDPELG